MANEIVECAITTFDNPYNPFEQFVLWDLFDKEKGYCSNQKVARLLQENERAIDLLISLDFTNTFKKVRRTDYKDTL